MNPEEFCKALRSEQRMYGTLVVSTSPFWPKIIGDCGLDFIFIDGWHTFDYTLVDFFYADLLVREGGMIIVDDVLHRGVNKFEKYIKTNYGFYKQLNSPKTVGCFKKLRKDDRDWDFHRDF